MATYNYIYIAITRPIKVFFVQMTYISLILYTFASVI